MVRPMVCGLFALAGVMACLGCGKARPKAYPVSGQVLYRTKPLAEAVVTFHPLSTPASGPVPSATTDAEGRFHLTSYMPNDGAPPGDYRVTILLLERRKDGDEVLRNGGNLLPPRYADPGSSGMTVTIKPHENVLAAFTLTD